MKDLPQDLSEYKYSYPEELVAYAPLPARDESRLLVVRKNPAPGLPRFEDCKFTELPQIIKENEELKKLLLVRNRSKVLPARFFAKRNSGSRHEIVLTERVSSTEWKAMIKNIAKIKKPEELHIENSEEKIEIIPPDHVKFRRADIPALLQSIGKVPLPPYIKREVIEEDKSRYQSVWAVGEAQSAAAPTASLHFTEKLWEKIAQSGIASADVFLHVGRGTFEALRETDLRKVELHEEAYEVEATDAEKIWKSTGVFAIGTTACRLTETLAQIPFEEGASPRGYTKLFIGPDYEFKKVRALLTNFHLPQSSLLVLVSVFAGSLSFAKEAYAHAVKKEYRLFSYGDASLWL